MSKIYSVQNKLILIISFFFRKDNVQLGLNLILLARCPALDRERARWDLGRFGAADNRMHITVGFAHKNDAFCVFLEVSAQIGPSFRCWNMRTQILFLPCPELIEWVVFTLRGPI